MSQFHRDTVKVTVQGRNLKCLACGGEEFHKMEAQLNTAGRSFLGLEWTSPTGVCSVCAQCGYIHWFLPQ